MGSATLSPTGAFEAGSYQSFTLVYTAGAFGIDDTGSIKIGLRFATDFGPVQFDDPKAPGYTTLEASNGATLEARWEFKRNIRPWSRSLYIGVMKHFLKPGDTITIRFGDTRFGSPGVRLQTYCEKKFEFRVLVDAIATYDYVALPESPTIEIAPGPGQDWHALLPTMVRAGAPFRFGIKVDDAWGNPSDKVARTVRLKASRAIDGLPSVVELKNGTFGATLENLVVRETGDLTIDVLGEGGAQLARSNPLRVVDASADAVHFWADTHGQSDETLGTNPAREYFKFGRDRAYLDVMSHQGNDFQITGDFWRDLNAATAELDEPGRFVCIPGYEWSANTAVGGDRNVMYRREGETIHRSSHAQITEGGDMIDERNDAHDAAVLFEKLAGKDCVVMAHVGGRYADIIYAHDGKLETAVEVHSDWGTFEWILRDAFEKNYRVGVVCNSDGHKGRPGASYPGASFFGSQGGLTCYLAPRLDRDAIFEAMRRRHHYGTTGNRMLVSVAAKTASDAEIFVRDPAHFDTPAIEKSRRAIMGDIARVADDAIELHVEVVGSAAIERLDIFNGLDLVETIRTYSAADLGRRVRLTYSGAEYRGRARTTVWDGSLSVAGNAIAEARMFNNWNLDRGIRSRSADGVTWKAVTTGNYGGIDLLLSDAASGTIKFETKHCSGESNISDLGVDARVFPGGGLEREVMLARLPEKMTETRMQVTRRIAVPRGRDTRLFVRVTQEDGHRAWTSPIYLFR
jgi:hypothetical protein